VPESSASRPPIDWARCVPFILLHLACLSVIWVGWSWAALGTALATYWLRVFGLTAFYHRYFSHRSFKTSRWFQFVGALLGSAAGQRGPIWWAAHHRDHHRHSDKPADVHSPHQHGFWFSHMGWFMTRENYPTRERNVPDLLRYPELRFLERYDFLITGLLAVAMFAWGTFLARAAPELETNGLQMLVWAFLISTIVLYHVTYSINSIAHVFGSRRYATKDDSRNNLWLALVTFGEGWHNNHHYYPAAARQGFYWWEVDVTYYLLVLLSWCGLVWDLKSVPVHVRDVGRLPSPESGDRS
jgi:stearoyl-CoA desaturase (Delta-9 desaturase)